MSVGIESTSSMASVITSGMLAGMDSSISEKVRENRLRRMAERQGLRLVKSRRRDPRAIDYGEMWLNRYVVYDNNGKPEAVANPEGTHDAWIGPFRDLDDLEAHLTGESS